MIYATSVLPGGTQELEIVGKVVLAHDERHLRRKLLHLEDNSMVMLDLKAPVHLAHGDILALDNGNFVEVVASEEPLMEVRARDQLHLTELAWHLGNRHLKAQIEGERILILRDHVIRDMLERLGAQVADVTARFQPVHGAYHSHGKDHDHGHGHGHHHH